MLSIMIFMWVVMIVIAEVETKLDDLDQNICDGSAGYDRSANGDERW